MSLDPEAASEGIVAGLAAQEGMSVLLIGEPSVDKTDVVEGLAQPSPHR
jgi:ATP-dependent Clp protease ATP-binding subunit ClpA